MNNKIILIYFYNDIKRKFNNNSYKTFYEYLNEYILRKFAGIKYM